MFLYHGLRLKLFGRISSGYLRSERLLKVVFLDFILLGAILLFLFLL